MLEQIAGFVRQASPFIVIGALILMAKGTHEYVTRRPRERRSTFTKAEKERIMQTIDAIAATISAAAQTLDDGAATLQSSAAQITTALAGSGLDTSPLDGPLANLANAIGSVQAGVTAVQNAAGAPPAPPAPAPAS